MTDPIAQDLEMCGSSAVFEVLRSLGHQSVVLPSDLRPVTPGRTLAGRVSTVAGRTDSWADAEQTLVAWVSMLSGVEPGTILVCQPNDAQVAVMGGLSAETLCHRGVRGYIVDGGCRDVEAIARLGFPVWCRFFTPRGVAASWLPDAYGEPVVIGDVRIEPGDYVVADGDGVVLVPGGRAGDVAVAAKRSLAVEQRIRADITAGVDPLEAHLRHRHSGTRNGPDLG